MQESGPGRFIVQLGADASSTADRVLNGMPSLPAELIGATLILDYEGCNPRLKLGDVIAVTGDFFPAMKESSNDRKESV